MYRLLQPLFLTGFAVLPLFFMPQVHAQYYSFSHFNQPMVMLSGGTSFDVCDEMALTDVELGFDFPVMDVMINSIQLNQQLMMKEFDANGTPVGVQFFPFGASYGCVNAMATGTYATTGTPGNRVFSVQWENLGFMNDTTGLQFINLQARLFESNGTVEFHIGDSYITQDDIYFTDEPGGFTAIIKYNPGNSAVEPGSICLVDPAETPIMTEYTDVVIPYTLIGTPNAGKVYRFTHLFAGLGKDEEMLFSVSPNPATDFITVDFREDFNGTVRLYTISGQEAGVYAVNGLSLQMDVSGLTKGLYFLKTDQSERSTKLVLR